ncbi:MAG: hypothetical protein R6U98_22875, partial [Pirellulaceae bacterium]
MPLHGLDTGARMDATGLSRGGSRSPLQTGQTQHAWPSVAWNVTDHEFFDRSSPAIRRRRYPDAALPQPLQGSSAAPLSPLKQALTKPRQGQRPSET